MAGQNMLQKLNAAKGKPPVSAAGGSINPLALIGGFLGGIPGSILGVSQLEGSTPQNLPPSARLLEGRARHAGQTGMYGRYGQADPSLRFVPATQPASEKPRVIDRAPAATGSPAAERAFEAEKARVAQLTAQDPELQRYERARGVAKTQEEMNAVRDEGMRIWAAKHGGLAAKVKPGSSGYEAIQSSIGPSTDSALSNEQVLGLMSFDPNTVLKTTQGIQGQFRPNQQLTGQEILSAMSFDPNVAMKSAANMAYAPMSPAEAAMLQEVGGAQGEYITPMNAAGGVGQARSNTALFEELLKRAASKK